MDVEDLTLSSSHNGILIDDEDYNGVHDDDDDDDPHNIPTKVHHDSNSLPPTIPSDSECFEVVDVANASQTPKQPIILRTLIPEMTFLRDIVIHAFLASVVCIPIFMPLYRYGLYDFFIIDNNTTNITSLSYESLSVQDKIRYKVTYYNVCHFAIFAALYFTCCEMFHLFQERKYVYYLRVLVVTGFVAETVSTYVVHAWMPSLLWFMGTAMALVFMFGSFVIAVIGLRGTRGPYEVQSPSTSPQRDVLLCGVFTCVALVWANAVITFDAFRESEAFRWTAPLVVPMTVFVVRYWGQRAPLPEGLVSRLSVATSVSTYSISRAAQCAYISDTLTADDITSFMILEIFYDCVALIFRVTLYHRQHLMDSVVSFMLCAKNATLTTTNTKTLRSRIISTQCVVHACTTETIFFNVLFITRWCLLTNHNEQVFLRLAGLFIACVLLQIIFSLLTIVLVRKIDSVPLEVLDVPIMPIQQLLRYHFFYCSTVLMGLCSFMGIIFRMWYPNSKIYL